MFPIRGVWPLAALLTLVLVLPSVSPGAEFAYPISVAASEKGAFFVADRNLPGVWKIEDGTKSVFFQADRKFRTKLNAVRCVALDLEGHVLAGDSATRQVYRLSDSGEPTPLLTSKTGIGIPMAIAVNKAGEIFIADLETHWIWRAPAAGGEPVKFVGVDAPRGIAFDGEDRLWAVSAGNAHAVVRFAAAPKPDDAPEESITLPFEGPHMAHTIAIDKAGAAYVADNYGKTIWKIGDDRKPAAWLVGDPLVSPVGLAWQGETLLVADPRAKAIISVDASGKATPLEIK